MLADESQAIQWMKGEGGRSSTLDPIMVNQTPVFALNGSQVKVHTLKIIIIDILFKFYYSIFRN